MLVKKFYYIDNLANIDVENFLLLRQQKECYLLITSVPYTNLIESKKNVKSFLQPRRPRNSRIIWTFKFHWI